MMEGHFTPKKSSKSYKLLTSQENTWCPGCSNYLILEALKESLLELEKEKKIKIKNVAIVTGIGCHGKIYDYLNLNAFYSIHGRVLPTAFGLKFANPQLTVLGFGGDGDTYSEGACHFLHAFRYNFDITMIVHNNQVFALTTGQPTPTTEKGFKSKSHPQGKKENPLNPILLSLLSGAGFVARAYALEKDHLKKIIKAAILYEGFSFIDVLQPCLTFHNTIPYFSKRIYFLEKVSHNFRDFNSALKRAREWDYSLKKEAKIPLGIFYKNEKIPPFPLSKKPFWKRERKINWQKMIKENFL